MMKTVKSIQYSNKYLVFSLDRLIGQALQVVKHRK